MKKKYVLIVLIGVFWLFLGWVEGAIPASERAALIALYNGINEGDWYFGWFEYDWKKPPLHTDGFAMPGTEGSWAGITVKADHVTRIYLLDRNLRGSIAPEIGNLSMLEYLNLGCNKFLSGTIPAELGKLSHLKELDLAFNQIGGPIPPQLGNLKNLTLLSLVGNILSGSIPSQLGNLINLKELYLGHNQLQGVIPFQLGNLKNLQNLFLSLNHLRGNIPSELGNLINLTSLSLDNNQLSGSIPAHLGNLINLTSLGLDNNQLSGNIPPEIINLFNYSLDSISLSHNQMSGGLSFRLGNMKNLTGLNLAYNYFSGPVPSSFINLKENVGLHIGHNCLYATDPELRDWLNKHDPEWDTRQEECSRVLPEINPPFGSFDSPINGSNVAGSIAVTGWALDDGGLDSVKIYLNQGDTAIFIGDALFVDGARPDVVIAYPQYPDNTKAGWGYMMLTYFLPSGGNGAFVLSAIATDLSGKTTILGTKTIFVDNAHAVKPFGAIDTPSQGGMASGSGFINWGWVLTPLPNSMPTHGSTIDVWVDGVNKGHPVYNNYREDIATLFPGYANSHGAVGYFYLDTTPYTNGVHTIQWTATDNVGNTDGIGSRYFTILNSSGDKSQHGASSAKKINIQPLSPLPMDAVEPIFVKKGFHADNEFHEYHELPLQKGRNHRVVIKEMEPVTIQLGERYVDIQGYLSYGKTFNTLPIGSTLDKKSGTFSWSPGPGFLGSYSLVFVLTDIHGDSFKKSIEIQIEPKL